VKSFTLILLIGLINVSCNPFAPELDTSIGEYESILGDQTTVEGVFENLRYAYTFRDTTIYGQLLNPNYTFLYRDYDRGVDISWGRDEEMRVTLGLFRNTQRLDLIWNNIISRSDDSLGIRSVVNRNFNLTVTFNPSDIVRVDGYVNLTLVRSQPGEKWMIMRWRDESNF